MKSKDYFAMIEKGYLEFVFRIDTYRFLCRHDLDLFFRLCLWFGIRLKHFPSLLFPSLHIQHVLQESILFLFFLLRELRLQIHRDPVMETILSKMLIENLNCDLVGATVVKCFIIVP